MEKKVKLNKWWYFSSHATCNIAPGSLICFLSFCFAVLTAASYWSVTVQITCTSSRYEARNSPMMYTMTAQKAVSLTVVTAIGMCHLWSDCAFEVTGQTLALTPGLKVSTPPPRILWCNACLICLRAGSKNRFVLVSGVEQGQLHRSRLLRRQQLRLRPCHLHHRIYPVVRRNRVVLRVFSEKNQGGVGETNGILKHPEAEED